MYEGDRVLSKGGVGGTPGKIESTQALRKKRKIT